ncbi:MAG: valine--tRNA ligase [archaeon]
MLKEKSWNREIEKKIAKKWQKNDTFSFKPGKDNFAIDTPPPYPSGRPWHIGAAAHYSQIDMIARTARMQCKNVHFPIGIDRNGLPVERYTEKKNKIKMHSTPREKFVELCSVALDDLEAEMLEIMKNMGMSCEFKNYYRTDSKEYRALTQSTFIELWNKKLIYEDTRPNNYCVDCGTTIADAEISYEEIPTELVHIKFRVKETGKDIVIATTRPELLCACQVVMFNPKDERYKGLGGKHAFIPLFEREVEIVAHNYAKPEFGSGAVMICSYGDYDDVRIFRELKLQEIIAIDKQGKMTEKAGDYKGLKILEARKKIIADLEKEGKIEKTEKINHRTPTCERSNTPIEIISMNEFYLKQLDFLPILKKFSEKLVFYPEMNRQLLVNWINSVSMDWPISRRRYYGTEVPVWRCTSCEKIYVPKADYKTYHQPWKQKIKEKCKCGASDWKGDERTFDTWMDSSISPLYISKFQKDKNFFNKTFPNSIRPQGKDIVRTWLYYTLLRCYQLTDKQAWKSAWVMGSGLDEKGERMSKSKGNVVDPIPIIEKYGGDAFRFWAASEAALGSDFRCSEARIEVASKFLSKFWNVARFISSFKEEKKPAKLEELDKWIVSELENLAAECEKGYSEFNFFIPSNAIRNFVWNLFASNYLELVKSRAYSNDKSALYTLHYCLRSVLILLSPITPFMCDYISEELYGKDINSEKFFKNKFKEIQETKELVELNSLVWKEKKDKGLSLKSEIKSLHIPKSLVKFKSDLIKAHNCREIKEGKLGVEFI